MLKNQIITLLSDDKPGIVESIASVITRHNGNWLESQLAQLGGKFAGVIRVQIEEEELQALREALEQLSSQQIRVYLDDCSEQTASTANNLTLSFHATGPDRPGIVREISSTLAQYQINLEKLDTRLSSMPYSGDPLFEAEGTMSVPPGLDRHQLEERLDEIANTLAMDISLG